MPDYQLSYDEIEGINLEAMRQLAPSMPARETRLSTPEGDLGLFFSLAPGSVMLDVGCGTARYAYRFIDQGMQYTGVDYSEEMLARARLNNLMLCKRFQVMNYHQLGFEDETFDALWACCVLNGEPKARLPETLGEFFRVLKPGGLLMIVQPRSEMSTEELTDEDDSFGRMYLSCWTFEEFRQTLLDQGFQLIVELERPESGSMTFGVTK